MPIKIKSRIAASKKTHSPAPDTPLRTGLERSGSGSGLKNLSQQRDRKKLEKQRDSSVGKDSGREIVESLVSLEGQYEQMCSFTKSNRQSVKRSLTNIRGVPHTTITLKPKVATRDSLSSQSLNSTISRVTSFCGSENTLKVVSIGSLCQQKRPKKKGIHISLASTVGSRRFRV